MHWSVCWERVMGLWDFLCGRGGHLIQVGRGQPGVGSVKKGFLEVLQSSGWLESLAFLGSFMLSIHLGYLARHPLSLPNTPSLSMTSILPMFLFQPRKYPSYFSWFPSASYSGTPRTMWYNGGEIWASVSTSVKWHLILVSYRIINSESQHRWFIMHQTLSYALLRSSHTNYHFISFLQQPGETVTMLSPFCIPRKWPQNAQVTCQGYRLVMLIF